MSIEIRHRRVTLEQIRDELDQFEERYGVPSERREEAFDTDDRCFNEELNRWSKLYEMWASTQDDPR